jgi:hypothetical protein
MEAIKKEREAQRYHKHLEQTGELLAMTTKELWDRLDETDPAAFEEDSMDVNKKRKIDLKNDVKGVRSDVEKGQTANAKKTKKKKTAISSLVGIIKGCADDDT